MLKVIYWAKGQKLISSERQHWMSLWGGGKRQYQGIVSFQINPSAMFAIAVSSSDLRVTGFKCFYDCNWIGSFIVHIQLMWQKQMLNIRQMLGNVQHIKCLIAWKKVFECSSLTSSFISNTSVDLHYNVRLLSLLLSYVLMTSIACLSDPTKGYFLCCSFRSLLRVKWQRVLHFA